MKSYSVLCNLRLAAFANRVGTTGGNRLREIQQELLQAQYADAGIEITIANTEGTGWSANMLPNMTSTQEVAVDYSSVSAESITWAPRS